jgi:hypothetical protein
VYERVLKLNATYCLKNSLKDTHEDTTDEHFSLICTILNKWPKCSQSSKDDRTKAKCWATKNRFKGISLWK